METPTGTPQKHGRNAISNGQKAALRAKRARRPGMTYRDLAKWFEEQYNQHINPSSISRILSKRYDFIDNLNVNRLDAKRFRQEKWPTLEKAVSDWVFHPANTATISQEVIRNKAKQYWEALYPNEPMPSFSNGWLASFQQRYNITYPNSRRQPNWSRQSLNNWDELARRHPDLNIPGVTTPATPQGSDANNNEASTASTANAVTPATPLITANATNAGSAGSAGDVGTQDWTWHPSHPLYRGDSDSPVNQDNQVAQVNQVTPAKVPEEEFESAKHKHLIGLIQRKIGSTVPPTIWAFFWLADDDRLEKILTSAQAGINGVFVRSYLLSMEKETKVLLKWMQKERQPSTPASTSTAPRAQCKQRDSNRCIITKDQMHDVAHIYPRGQRTTTMETGEPNTNMWTPLRYFFSEARVKAWHAAVFPEGRYVDDCSNLLCLSPSAHRYFRAGYFALKPITLSEDKTSLTVQFYWLVKGDRPASIDLSTKPSLDALDRGPGCTRLFDHENLGVFKSGDKITITTDDPGARPLPNWQVLEFQWYMNRVIAMSGAADVDWDDEMGDDGDALGEDVSLFSDR